MTRGKTLDGAYDIEADTLTVNESSDLRGNTTVDGPARFNQNIDLQNETNKITISASEAIEDYTINLPPSKGESGQILSTDGLGNSSWASISTTTGGVSYISISTPEGFIKVNGLNSDSTYTNKTFNLELSGSLPITYGGTGLNSVGEEGQVLTTDGSGLTWRDPFREIAVQAPLSATLGLSPTISLLTVPISKGGTGLTSAGAAGYLLSSNGSQLQWQAPNTFFGVESVSASVPLGSTGGIYPNVYIKDYTGVGDVVLKIGPQVINPIITNGTFNIINGVEYDSGIGFCISVSPSYFGEIGPGFVDGNPLRPILIGDRTDLIIRNKLYNGPYPIDQNGSIQIKTGIFFEIIPDPIWTDLPNYAVDFVYGRRFQLANVYQGGLVSGSFQYANGHPLKQLPPSMFEEYGGSLGLRIKNAKSFFKDNASKLYLRGGQYTGLYYVSAPADDFLEFQDSNYGGRGHPTGPIDVLVSNTEGVEVKPSGDIELLSAGRGVFMAKKGLTITSHKETVLKSEGKLKIFSGNGNPTIPVPGLTDILPFLETAIIEITCPFGPISMYGQSFDFFTTATGTGGLDSLIVGTIAWNSTKDFEATAFQHVKLYAGNKMSIQGCQNMNLIVDNVSLDLGIPGLKIPVIPIPASEGDITIACKGKTFVPFSGLIPVIGTALTLTGQVPVGSIYLTSSGTGQIYIQSGAKGVTIESPNYVHAFAGIPVIPIPEFNYGIKLKGHDGAIVMTTNKKTWITCKEFELQSDALTINPGYVTESNFDGADGTDTTAGDITAKNPCYFIETVTIRKNLPANSRGGEVQGAILKIPASDWYNRYNDGGTCSIWSAVHFDRVRIITEKQYSGGIQQNLSYTIATTMFIDEPYTNGGATSFGNIYAVYINGRCLIKGFATFENKINMPSNFIDMVVIGGNNPTQATNIKLQNGEEQSLVLGIAGASGNYSTSAVQGDVVISGDEDHNLFIQTGSGNNLLNQGAAAIKISSNVVSLPNNFINTLVVGGTNLTQATGVLIKNGITQFMTMGIAGAPGNYSTDALQGDVVIVGDSGHNFYIQTGSGGSAIKITTANLVVIRKGLTISGEDSANSPALVVGRVDIPSTPISIRLMNDYTQDFTIGLAGTADTFSSSAALGDTVIRTHASKSLYIQTGVGYSRFKIDTSNIIHITAPEIITPLITSTLLSELGTPQNIGLYAIEGKSTVYHVFGYDTSSPANYGRILTNYVSSGSASNFISFGNTRASISFAGDGRWNLLALSNSAACTISGSISHDGDLTISSLTASFSVHTDASKKLVSVQNNGSGLNILQTSPTLITPTLGVATGTSLQLSSLTASFSVHTDASKNLVSVQNNGSGLNILQTNPTLVAPDIGSAFGASLSLSSTGQTAVFGPAVATTSPVNISVRSGARVLDMCMAADGSGLHYSLSALAGDGVIRCTGALILQSGTGAYAVIISSANNVTLRNCNVGNLTASCSVHTDASKNLVSIANNGSGLNILQTSPTLITPVLGVATGTTLSLSSQSLNVLTFTGGNLRPAFIGCLYTGVSFGSSLSFGVNLSGSTGGSTYSTSQQGGRYIVQTESGLHSWTGKAAGADTETAIMSLTAAGALNLIGAISSTGINLSSLTASFSVHTDATKNLVSVQNNGSGLNILQTSPTLITPNIGVASATSLTLSSLAVNCAVQTNGSSQLVTISNNGSGLNILQTSPTLITPNIGVASATSLTLSSLAVNCAVQTNGSSQLVTISNNGSGLNILQTSPTLITPNIGVATGTSLSLSTTGQNAIFGPSASGTVATGITVRNSTAQYLDIGIAGGTGNYSTAALIGDVVIRSGTNMYLQCGTVGPGMKIDASNNITVYGLSPSLAVFSNSSRQLVSRPGFSYQFWTATGLTGVPNATWTVITNVIKVQNGGQGELVQFSTTDALFRNDNGVPMLYMCTFNSVANSGIYTWKMRIDCNGVMMSQQELGDNRVSCVSATGLIGPSQILGFYVRQDSGFGQDATAIRITITTYPIL